MRAALVSAVVLASVAAGSGGASPSATKNTRVVSAPHFSLEATSRCLVRRDAKVGRVLPSDQRLRALRDLAQRTSIQVKLPTGLVGIAFSKTASDARLLAELLVVPKDPYRIAVRGNALLMYKPASRKERVP